MSLIFAIIAYAIVGILAGVLGGLLGIGGGIVTVPCLYFIFKWLGYPQTYIMHLAIGTSLSAMILNTLSSTYAHNKRGSVMWDIVKKMAFGLVAGSLIGALIATALSTVILKIVFGIFLCLLALNLFRKRPIVEGEHRLPKTPLLTLWSCGISGISNILGIGGGSLFVPFFTHHYVSHKKAIGTSLACSLLITSIGAVSYLIMGLGDTSLPEGIGFIDLPSFIVIGVVSFFTAPYGVKLTHELSPDKIRKIFAIVLLVTGILMMVK